MKVGATGEETREGSHDLAYVAAVGASAGGLEALIDLVGGLPKDLYGGTIIIAQHMSPSHRSRMVDLLKDKTPAEVREARHLGGLEAGVIWITPANRNIVVGRGRILLEERNQHHGPSPSINRLYTSIAEEFGRRAVGILLSGTGSDGTKGFKEISRVGGCTMVQEPDEAKYSGMPESALQAVEVDYMSRAGALGEYLARDCTSQPEHRDAEKNHDGDFRNQILNRLAEWKGADFSGYKISSIDRRLQKRFQKLNLRSSEEYTAYLDHHPGELEHLFQTLLIGVTSFFRDVGAFQSLRSSIGKLLEQRDREEPFRVWVPGCATGEEAYSLAILLEELFNQQGDPPDYQIFATDIHEDAIIGGRIGRYDRDDLDNLTEHQRASYFVRDSRGFRVVKEVRSKVLFSVHDITQQPPFLNLDLISCRNLMIYFGKELQKKIIPLFHYALHPEGYLFLGKSESVGSFDQLFEAVDKKNNIYRRKAGMNPSGFDFLAFSQGFKQSSNSSQDSRKGNNGCELDDRIRETLYQSFEQPYVVINDSLDVLKVQGDVQPFLRLGQGPMNTNILNLVNDDLQIDLRSAVFKGIKQHSPFETSVRKIHYYGEDHYVQIRIKPLVSIDRQPNLFLVIFQSYDDEHTEVVVRTDEEVDSDRRVQELKRELEATREQLQTYIEELETSSEELQALNEELQAANEELQASNEELETANEELQSTNEEKEVANKELQQLNRELRSKDRNLRKVQAQQEAMLKNRFLAFILIDQGQNVLRFNEQAVDLVKSLDNRKNLKVERKLTECLPEGLKSKLKIDLQRALDGEELEKEYRFRNTDGESIWYSVTMNPVSREKGDDVVSIGLFNIDDIKRARIKLEAREELLNAMLETTNAGIALARPQGTIELVNEAFAEIFDYSKDELQNKDINFLLTPESHKRIKHENLLDKRPKTIELSAIKKGGGRIDILLNHELLEMSDGNRFKVCTAKDITEEKNYLNILEESQDKAFVGGWEYDLLEDELRWTDKLFDLYELPGDKQPGLDKAFSYFEEESRVRLRKAFVESLATGDSYNLELKMITDKGNEKWVQVSGKPVMVYDEAVKIYGSLQDITPRKRAEIEKEQLSSVVRNTQNAVVILTADRRIEWVNESYEQLTGYQFSELKGKSPGDLLFGPESDPDTKAYINEKMDSGEPFETEVLNYRKDGNSFWKRMEVTPHFDENGGLLGYSSVQTDITDRVQAKIKLEESLEEKRVLLQEIHHRVKNNLAVVSSLLTLQADEVEDGRLQSILRESQHRIQMIGQIHEKLYQSDSLSRVGIDKYLKEICENVIKTFEEEGQQLDFQIEADNIHLNINQAIPFGLIVNELITNSAKHGFKGQKSGEIKMILWREDEQCHLAIDDNGAGLPDDFDPYMGDSMGMVLVTTLVEQLDAQLNYENTERGARFTISFAPE